MRTFWTVGIGLLLLTGCSEDSDHQGAGPQPEQEEIQISGGVTWPKGTSTIEIPLEYLNGSLPAVRCRINGKPAIIVVDTASQSNALYRNRLDYFGVDFLGERNVPVYTAGGTRKARLCGEYELELKDGLKFEPTNAFVIPGYEGNSSDGILGLALLNSLNAVIDLEKDVLILRWRRENRTTREDGSHK